MSDSVKHECGIAFLRLRKPLEFYLAKYGNPVFALQKMSLLMEKQHNRGQDGAGLVCVKLNMLHGKPYINRLRNNSATPIIDTFNQAFAPIHDLKNTKSNLYFDIDYLKENIEFTGEVFLGHLRYGTFGKNNIKHVHPFIRPNNWKTRNLILAGNFNMTNSGELFQKLIQMGQHPVETADTVTIMEQIGYYLDEENDKLYQKYKTEGLSRIEISKRISNELDIANILRNSSKMWDGGYVLAGVIGNGDSFIMRDPSGIRPAFYYADDEIVVATSERPVIQTSFNIHYENVKEILPGQALIVKSDGSYSIEQIIEPNEEKHCSFERIYFSRGTDADIYKERKKLGRLIVPKVLEAINYDIENTVFSYIPNTAIVAFMGMYASLLDFTDKVKRDKIMALKNPTADEIDNILSLHPRAETIAVKDMKMRTFITTDKDRDDLVDHIYDVTYGLVRNKIDNLVVIDDSIVRGTTLKQSIIKILDRLEPKTILIASSAPQIRYPDCYGIDMAKLGDFIAFRAAIELLHDTKQTHIIDEVYKLCKEQINKPKEEMLNHVKKIYEPFSADQISDKIAEMITPKGIYAKISVVFQSIENLHLALKARGDWYFTGNYPTQGGNAVVTQAFINFMEGRNQRAY